MLYFIVVTVSKFSLTVGFLTFWAKTHRFRFRFGSLDECAV